MDHDKNLTKQREKLLRADPRREPTIPPAADEGPSSTDQIADAQDEPREQANADESLETSPKTEAETTTLASEHTDRVRDNTSVVTNVDPRWEKLEPLVSRGNWSEVIKLLGTPEQAGRLPPNLGLVYALAAKEEHLDEEHTGEDKEPFRSTQMAIRCMAGLIGVDEQSGIALLLTKRMLRSNPVTWRQAPAPSGKISAIILLLAGIIGGGIGWFLSLGYVSVRIPWFH